MSHSRLAGLKLGLAVLAATVAAAPLADAPVDVAAQIAQTATLTHNGKTYPPQSTVLPVNDLPGPYERVHPWGEIPYDAGDYDGRAAVIGVAEGPDGHIYVLTRCNRNSCAGRPEPPILKFDRD